MNDFDFHWNEYIKPLKSREINTVTGKTNTIINVSDDFLERKSSQGNKSKIDKIFFENVYNDLLKNKALTRAYINKEYRKRCSSIVTVVLAEIPNVEIISSPTIILKIK